MPQLKTQTEIEKDKQQKIMENISVHLKLIIQEKLIFKILKNVYL